MLGLPLQDLTLESGHRGLVEMTYRPPQVPADLPPDEIVENYMFDYRRMFIEHPRVRLDGVYIAVCHYVCVISQNTSISAPLHARSREGSSENAWVNVRR